MFSTQSNIASQTLVNLTYQFTLYDFLIKHKIKFINVYQYYNDKGKKVYDGMWAGWHNYTFDDLVKERDRRGTCQQNSHFIRLEDTDFLVIDIDIDKDAPEHEEMIDELVDTYGGGVEFTSFSGKTHIWVKKHPDDKNKKNIIPWKITPKGNVDLIYTGICEKHTGDKLIDFETLFDSCFTDYHKETDLDRNIVVSDDILNSELSTELIEILELIKVEYWEGYNSWWALILAIYKITGSVDIADKYSQKGSNYEDGVVEKKINSCHKFQFGEGTIRHYAKLSNESKYNEIRARFMKFDDIENITDKDLAEKVLEEIGDTIIYDEPTDDVYILQEKTNIWKKCKKDRRELKNLTSKVLGPIIDAKLSKFKGINDLDDKQKQEKKKLNLVRSKISNNTSRGSIKEAMVDILQDNEHDYKLDESRPELFCFSNGKAMNLKTKTIIDIQPTDYITFTSGLPYIPLPDAEYEAKGKIFNSVNDKIFPKDNDQKESFHSFHRECLSLIKLEKFVMMTGEGRNGKGWYMKFLKYIMGPYFYTASKTLLTQPEKPGGDPQTASIDLKRYVNVREPGENEKINISRVKELTGEVDINARLLHSNNTNCRNYAKFGMECNLVPKTDEQPTNAFANRLIIYRFVSRFTDVSEEVDEKNNIYAQDRDLKENDFYEKIRMYYLIRLLKHTREGLWVPEKVKATADLLVLDNDRFFSWIETNITMIDESARPKLKKDYKFITFNQFVERYRQTFRDKYTSNQIKERLRMNMQLKKRGLLSSTNPKHKKEGWCLIHCEFKTPEEKYNRENLY